MLKMMFRSRRDEVLRENLLRRRQEVQSYVPAVAGQAEALDCELEAIREDTLEHIEKALAEIEGGTYGSCLGCHEQISEQRLMALPLVKLCIECDLKAEFEFIRQQVRARRQPLFD